MSKNLRRQNRNQSVSIERRSVEFFSGPFPHPDILKKFNDVVPGSAERIIKMAEDQSAHRKELENKVIASDISRS